jgi:hypothetical protein
VLCWLCETAKFFYTSYIDVNINIKLCFVSQRSSDTESVMTQMEMLACELRGAQQGASAPAVLLPCLGLSAHDHRYKDFSIAR